MSDDNLTTADIDHRRAHRSIGLGFGLAAIGERQQRLAEAGGILLGKAGLDAHGLNR